MLCNDCFCIIRVKKTKLKYNMEYRCKKIGCGKQYTDFNELESHHVIAQGWGDSGDLTFMFRNEEEANEYISLISHDEQSGINAFKQILLDIESGDIMLACQGNKIIGITEVPPKFIYLYDDDMKDYKNCLFPVKWIAWNDFCKDESVFNMDVSKRGVSGITNCGISSVNRYIKQYWKQFVNDNHIEIQPSECEEKLNVLLSEQEDRINKSRIDFYNALQEKKQKKKQKKSMERYINLIRNNYNLILTGAPGTGKTYLAKQIAAYMILGHEYDPTNENDKCIMQHHLKTIQFHPSYDYTDFVEGLRPIKKDDEPSISFERRDGVFKEFCRVAIKDSYINGVDNFDETWNKFLGEFDNQDKMEISLMQGGKIVIELNEFGTGLANRTYEDGNDAWIRGKSKFFSKDQLYNVYRGMRGVPSGAHDNYRKAIINKMTKYGLQQYKQGDVDRNRMKKPFVLIIDEINRGEVSKIFGELFTAIESTYRGGADRVQTQYQNLIEEGDKEFFDGFYVPDNLYIIGTMNDIDRSVESMDFAMRRRFAWNEVTAEDSKQMLDNVAAWKDGSKPSKEVLSALKNRMDNLNAAIIDKYKYDSEELSTKDKIGLTTAYQIGASYFLKYSLYDDFEKLWKNHLEVLLYDYLRGSSNVGEKMEKLHTAFKDETAH